MWWTNSLCTSANEDLGTFAEYDPLTVSAPLTNCNGVLGTESHVSTQKSFLAGSGEDVSEYTDIQQSRNSDLRPMISRQFNMNWWLYQVFTPFDKRCATLRKECKIKRVCYRY